MPRKPKRRRPVAAVRGLVWRNGRAYWQRRHKMLPSGRMVVSLLTADVEVAAQRAAALNTMAERGDWGAFERLRSGGLHVTEIARAVREGDYMSLRRVSAAGVRLGDAIERFLARSDATASGRTAAHHRTVLMQLQAELGADFLMHELTTERAERFLHDVKPSKDGVWAPATQKVVRVMCGSLWSMMIEQEAEAAEQANAIPTVTRNPWRKARTKKTRQTRHAFLQPGEWHDLITHPQVAGRPRAALLAVGCLAGLRDAEARHLRPGIDVLLGGPRPVIVVQDRDGEHAWETKTENSVREIPVKPALEEILREHIRRGFAGKRFLFHAWQRDRPLGAKTLETWTMEAFTAAGIKYGREGDALTNHSLRHTFASWMAAAGVPFHVIAELMGNTPAIVMATYAHLAPHDLDRAMDVIETNATNGAK